MTLELHLDIRVEVYFEDTSLWVIDDTECSETVWNDQGSRINVGRNTRKF